MSQPTEVWISTNCEYEDNGVDHVALSLESMIAHYAARNGVGTVTAKVDPDGGSAELTVAYPRHIQGVCVAHTSYQFVYRYLLEDLE